MAHCSEIEIPGTGSHGHRKDRVAVIHAMRRTHGSRQTVVRHFGDLRSCPAFQHGIHGHDADRGVLARTRVRRAGSRGQLAPGVRVMDRARRIYDRQGGRHDVSAARHGAAKAALHAPSTESDGGAGSRAHIAFRNRVHGCRRGGRLARGRRLAGLMGRQPTSRK